MSEALVAFPVLLWAAPLTFWPLSWDPHLVHSSETHRNKTRKLLHGGVHLVFSDPSILYLDPCCYYTHRAMYTVIPQYPWGGGVQDPRRYQNPQVLKSLT